MTVPIHDANPTVHEGSWAELIVVPQDMFIGPAPQGVDVATAGAAPLAGIAAIMAIDALDLSEGAAVLIVSATGGVGSLAVQLAARAGATVAAPALPEDEAYLRELGVSELLPRNGDFAAAAPERHPDGFDAVLDLVNYAPDVPAALAQDGGRVASPTGAAGEGPGRTMVMAAPTPESLDRLARLLADGTLRVSIQATFELAQAPDALAALLTRHTRGKLGDPSRVTAAGSMTFEFGVYSFGTAPPTRRSAGRTKVARLCKTRRLAPTSEAPKPVPER